MNNILLTLIRRVEGQERLTIKEVNLVRNIEMTTAVNRGYTLSDSCFMDLWLDKHLSRSDDKLTTQSMVNPQN